MHKDSPLRRWHWQNRRMSLVALEHGNCFAMV
eukprot:CAMPEP_0171122494 /NCGR_PEP_ID=MMETSP0766_2-20121228/105131_1 /TAXON_ID=439317 /ORGANISM="Gambierdiscus australes, Strain CAWD 149" /LENGTH=31 /DNA_ID= /DNA_START= /DNA_END= /DNA_ORIENTATION=